MIRPRTAAILSRAIEEGVALGCRRAMKHRDGLRVSTGDSLHSLIGEALEQAVAEALYEVFEVVEEPDEWRRIAEAYALEINARPDLIASGFCQGEVFAPARRGLR